MGCAAASLTPPNVSAASLEEDVLRPLAVNIAPPCRLDKDGKREKKSLLKLLSNKKKPRPSPPSSPTLEAELAAAGEGLHGASGPETTGSSPSSGIQDPDPPPTEVSYRRSGPSEGGAPIAPPPRQPCSSLLSQHQDSRPIICERYRVVVSYPPQSEAELELKEGDVVFVHRKREDGWFKGTLQRNGRTGLFPGSFVDSI